MTRVRISAGEREVEVEAAGAKAAVLADLAIDVWRKTEAVVEAQTGRPFGYSAHLELVDPEFAGP